MGNEQRTEPSGTLPAATVPRALARAAGVVAAMAALAAGELVSSFAGPDQSLIGSVGTEFIDRFAAPLKDFAVRTFGTNDKTALLVGIITVSLIAGAFIGAASLRRPQIAPIAFGAFGLLGFLSSLADPQANNAVSFFAAAVAVAAGIGTLRLLLRVAATGSSAVAPGDPGIEYPTNPENTRRAFFYWAGGAGALAIGVSVVGHALSGRSKAEVARASVKLPPLPARTNSTGPSGTVPDVAPLGIDGLSPYYVSNANFYRIDTAFVVPQVDPADWKLKITGLVDNPFELTYDDLLGMPQIEEAVTLQCVSNDVGGDLVGNARWQGVPLKALLDHAGVQAGGTQIVGKSVDGWTSGFPTELAGDGRIAMVALGMNREPLPIPHGFPARLVIAGLYGYVSATKWLSEIHLTGWDDFDGYWIDKGWAKKGPIKTQSRIDVPRAGASLAAGPQKIAGVAWAPTRGISKVEVQVDSGPWQTARLADAVSNNTWVQWVLDWVATPGDHKIAVRATDGTGATQTNEFAPPAPDGATGWHTISVTAT